MVSNNHAKLTYEKITPQGRHHLGKNSRISRHQHDVSSRTTTIFYGHGASDRKSGWHLAIEFPHVNAQHTKLAAARKRRAISRARREKFDLGDDDEWIPRSPAVQKTHRHRIYLGTLPSQCLHHVHSSFGIEFSKERSLDSLLCLINNLHRFIIPYLHRVLPYFFYTIINAS